MAAMMRLMLAGVRAEPFDPDSYQSFEDHPLFTEVVELIPFTQGHAILRNPGWKDRYAQQAEKSLEIALTR